MQSPVYHIPALLPECMEGLRILPNGTYVDVTFGGGGHSREIIRHLGPEGRLLAFDQDLDAQQNSIDDNRFTFIHSNFRFLKNFLRYYQAEHIDGLLADLGVSFHHFDEAERGFSFRFDGALDMRMNQQSPQTAATVLNSYDEERLSDIFYLYGELPQARKLANAIVKSRQTNPLQTINNLLEVARPYINRKQEKKELAQLFQALRIEVNAEMESLRKMLRQALDALNPGGRLVVLTYHSLEDRLVKNFFKTGNFEGKADKDFFGKITTPFKLINRKVIVPTEEEIERNPRSRSAKLRIAEKL
ncbi:MAG TPA: 16S rRNA (cytosine(1402)-N(4))-methyltransferase RsmH [Candidatus Gallibacteroides avistercoris]|uniref:Ribosomal RNA small subunit methyltransferase H n=1 Tax=Candidatus Gallibacteroides avistercoris TaxID=2840833 RepID=A0A9D1M948_9BACT|nr:16S rRNA (cytosine(1402)-N(4))-methyltransferase RsmH [Candidatus Gallibacteroides avistercoris]